ncbi:MAG: AtpZ/AtpI family protein [bacterium]
MDKETRQLFRTMGTLSSLGFTLVLATFAGLALGLWLDKLTGLKPLFTIGLLIFGIIAGFVKIYVEVKKIK